MSEIFNLVVLNQNRIEDVYIFKGKNEIESIIDLKDKISIEMWNYITTNGIEPHFINEEIYSDDRLITIKQKIIKFLNLTISIPEMYLFTLQEKKFQPDILYQQLTANEYLKLGSDRLNNFLKNIHDSDFFTEETYIENNIKKGLYLYSDLLKLDLFRNKIIVKKPLGSEINYKNIKYPFVVNPYEIDVVDNFIKEEYVKPSIINKSVLLTEGNILNNTIYLCKCSDVLDFYNNRGISDDYILKLYFPSFIIKILKQLKYFTKENQLYEN